MEATGDSEVTPYQDSKRGQEAEGLEVGCPEGLDSSKALAFPLTSASPFLSAWITRDAPIEPLCSPRPPPCIEVGSKGSKEATESKMRQVYSLTTSDGMSMRCKFIK